MADLRRRCPSCKRQFRPRKGSPRRYCEACRPPRAPKVADGQPIGAPPADPGVGPIEAAVAAELARAGRAETIEGVSLLTLARDADRMPPERRAVVVEKLLKVKALALAGVKAAGPDPVNDIARKRAERLASA